jgi:imidazolonepropionase-like amidohydrolase
MSKTVLENCTLLEPAEAEPREGVHVLVDGERIEAISEKRIRAGRVPRIDLAGRTLMPGLIDAHVHVVATSVDLGAIDKESATLTGARAAQIMKAMLHRGFTSVRDAGGADWGLAKAVEAGLIDGPRLFYSGRALSQTGGHGDFRPLTDEGGVCVCCAGAQFSVVADGVPEVQKAAREELRRGATQIKIMASGGVASPTDPIWNQQYSEDEIRAIVWEATSWKTYVMAHAYTPEAIARAVRSGVRSIEHGNLIDAETARLMADRGAFLVPTLATYEALSREGEGLGFPAVSLAKLEGVREAGLRSLEIAHAAGVPIGYGTDLLGACHQYQSEEFTIRARALPAAEVLASATTTNAALLNRSGELGTVREGALADLIVVDGDPLRNLRLLQGQGRHLKLIMKGGRIYKNELG